MLVSLDTVHTHADSLVKQRINNKDSFKNHVSESMVFKAIFLLF